MSTMGRTARAAVLGLALCAGGASADSLRPAQMDQLIANLGADAFETRRAAEEALSDPALLDTIEEETFVDIFNRDDLGPEQRHRLRNVYARWFSALEHAGMGVRFGQTNPDEPILIDQVTRGFPCFEQGILMDNDVITGIDGLSIDELINRVRGRTPAQQFLRTAIISREPGDTLEVTIKRAPPEVLGALFQRIADGEMRVNDLCISIAQHPQSQTIIADVPLGSYNDLNQRALPLSLIESASHHRLERLGVAIPRPRVILDEQMSDELWGDFTRKPSRRSHNDLMSAQAGIDPSVIRQQQKYIVRAPQDRRRPVPAQAEPQPDLGINAPIVVADATNLTQDEMRIIALQQNAQQQVKKLEERIAQQGQILADRSRTQREHFLAQGRIRDLQNERNKIITQYKAARLAFAQQDADEGEKD